MPTLPPDFLFSQGSLQDYADCPRRFQLRYLLELAWPAGSAEPADEFEARLAQGEMFHRMVQQQVLGIGYSADASSLAEPLATWWTNYHHTPPANLPTMRHPELILSAPLGEHRLVAKYDLIAVDPGRCGVIVDWKTSEKRPKAGWLAARFQTRVYRYLLVRAGAHLNACAALHPEQITMLYWFANFPDDPERLPYDATQYAADEARLTALIAEIAGLDDDGFPLTGDLKRCLFCPYRSLCNRGAKAGDLDVEEDDVVAAEEMRAAEPLAGFDFEQVAEIAY
jgi:CRISPR/Cas system-associated exonuclease Cas4 (RecB family)